MADWHNKPMVAFDIETTGTDACRARIVSLAVAECRGGAEPSVSTWLVDPRVEIPPEATAVHGLSDALVRERGVRPEGPLDAVADLLVSYWRRGLPCIVMNAIYDLTVLDAELRRHGLPRLGDRLGGNMMLVVDPLVLDRYVDRSRRGSRTLAELCRVYGVLLSNAHTAEADALAAARLAWRLADRFPIQLGGGLRELQNLQAKWYGEWAEAFEVWLRGNVDVESVVHRGWPLRDCGA